MRASLLVLAVTIPLVSLPVAAGPPGGVTLQRIPGPSAGAGVRLEWPTTAGLRYRVLQSSDLVGWEPAPGFPTVATGEVAGWEPPAGAGPRFYRVEEVSVDPPAPYTVAGVAPGPGHRGVEMVPIPAGVFRMGSSDSELGRSPNEGPQRQVTLTRPYWIGRFEVTQAQWFEVMGTRPSTYTDDGTEAPVENVSWEDAVEFCRRIDVLERAAGRVPEGYQYRLPTEAEWEHACRAGTATRFSYGDDDPFYSAFPDHGWHGATSLRGGTHAVGGKLPNPWGLHDVHGNVAEWCRDVYVEPFPAGDETDPAGPATGERRVFRGGSWHDFPYRCRSASRASGLPWIWLPNLGLRIACAPVIP